MHAEVYEDGAGTWRYRLLADNGENIGGSEAYTRRASAVRAVKRNTHAGAIHVYGRDHVLDQVIRVIFP